MANKKEDKFADGLNLSGLLTLASVAPQFSTFVASAEATHEVFVDSKEDLAQFFDSEEDLDSLIDDIKDISMSVDTIAEELQDRIDATLQELHNREQNSD